MSWEYLATRDDRDLVALGQQGWELVAALPAGAVASGAPTFYFKRPGPDFRAEVTAAQKARYYTQLGRMEDARPSAPPASPEVRS